MSKNVEKTFADLVREYERAKEAMEAYVGKPGFNEKPINVRVNERDGNLVVERGISSIRVENDRLEALIKNAKLRNQLKDLGIKEDKDGN